MQKITIRQPDDWHIHLRDGEALERTVADAARQFNRVIVMPNLIPPVKNVSQANAYYQRIMEHVPEGLQFEPLMVLYLTDNTHVDEILEAASSKRVKAVKLYPTGATTNSDSGVTDLEKLYPVFSAMQETGLPLLVHGEVTDSEIDIFDREKAFIDSVLLPITKQFPSLKVVLEHITTSHAVDFVINAPETIAATITAHHLLYNRNDMLAGGIRPHYYCLPILKRKQHQLSLIKAATSGNPKFFLGTDSAPHSVDKKETDCGCAGCYTANAAIELYAEVFEAFSALDKLNDFASVFGPNFYGLPLNESSITLEKNSWQSPDLLTFGQETIKPLTSGKTLQWRLATGK